MNSSYVVVKVDADAKRIAMVQMLMKITLVLLLATIVMFFLVSITYAAGNTSSATGNTSSNSSYQSKVTSVLKSFIEVIGFIFQAVGVVLGVYSAGQLVLAFKNEDADSKSRATTMLVVAVVLIALPSIIDKLNLIGNLTNSSSTTP